MSAACLAHAASAADVTTGSRALPYSFPWGCSGLQLEGPLGVCSSFSDAARKSSRSWLPLSPLLLDGCSAFVLLLLLLLLVDAAELLLPTFWSRVFCLLASIHRGSRSGDTASLSAARTPELHALEQEEQRLQRELRQYTPSSDFVAYARLQRQLAKVAAAKEACTRQQLQQQQQNSSSSATGEGGLWVSVLWPIMKPVLLAKSWVLMKPLICWLLFKGILGATVELPTSQLAPLTDTSLSGGLPAIPAKAAHRKPLELNPAASARAAAGAAALAAVLGFLLVSATGALAASGAYMLAVHKVE
ncbi:hypothetical protein Emag_004161 [Eimeria magna]